MRHLSPSAGLQSKIKIDLKRIVRFGLSTGIPYSWGKMESGAPVAMPSMPDSNRNYDIMNEAKNGISHIPLLKGKRCGCSLNLIQNTSLLQFVCSFSGEGITFQNYCWKREKCGLHEQEIGHHKQAGQHKQEIGQHKQTHKRHKPKLDDAECPNIGQSQVKEIWFLKLQYCSLGFVVWENLCLSIVLIELCCSGTSLNVCICMDFIFYYIGFVGNQKSLKIICA